MNRHTNNKIKSLKMSPAIVLSFNPQPQSDRVSPRKYAWESIIIKNIIKKIIKLIDSSRKTPKSIHKPSINSKKGKERAKILSKNESPNNDENS